MPWCGVPQARSGRETESSVHGRTHGRVPASSRPTNAAVIVSAGEGRLTVSSGVSEVRPAPCQRPFGSSLPSPAPT